MTRGLHPQTRPQRAESADGSWCVPRKESFETSDAPPRRVALALGGLLGLLCLSLAGNALPLADLRPSAPLGAEQARARFHTAAPRLLADPDTGHVEQSAFGPLTAEPSLARAMDQVVREGWRERSAPPPSRGATALDRASKRQ